MKMMVLLCIITTVLLTAVHSFAVTSILALIPSEKQFQQALESTKIELGPDFSINTVEMSNKFTSDQFVMQLKKTDAQALILMDTKAVTTVIELQRSDSTFIALPKFVLMTLMAEVTASKLQHACGITFEVPIYTLVTNFNIVSAKDFSKVGIFHRNSAGPAILTAQKLLKKEQLELFPVCIDCKNPEKTTIQDAMATMNKQFGVLTKRDKVDVVLLMADNLIVNNSNLGTFWIGKVKKQNIPVIAPLDMLASPEIGLALFTADPDLTQLGIQSANQILDYFENGTAIETIGFEPTISIKSTVNKTIARNIGWKLKEEKLSRINTIIP